MRRAESARRRGDSQGRRGTRSPADIARSLARRLAAGLVITTGLVSTAVQASPDTAVADLAFAAAVQSGRLENRRIGESSGLAVSTRHPDLLWTLNDSGGGAELFALSGSGADRGRVAIDGARNRDWEDMASYATDQGHFLLVGDIGDNNGNRAVSRLFAVAEPDLDDAGRVAAASMAPVWTLRFRYEDGPKDCESVAVDVAAGRIYLLTKRLVPAALYELPLGPAAGADEERIYVARLVGRVDAIPPPTAQHLIDDPLLGAYSSQPTAMDFSPDGRYAVVLTYRDAFVFERRPGDDWLAALARGPTGLGLPRIRQGEAVAVGPASIFVTSEEVHAPILRIDRLVQPDQPDQ